jgi:oligopeptidase B
MAYDPDARRRSWKRTTRGVIFALLALAPSAAIAQVALRAPVANRVDHISVWHGQKFEDPFHWLRDRSRPDTIKYLEVENAYTEAMTRDLQPFRDALYKEMLGHIKQTDVGVPVRRGSFCYYSRVQEGKQYPIRCRKKALGDPVDEKSAEEVLLDLNELAKGLKFFAIGEFVVSDDGSLLAYTTDTTGFRQYRLQIKDLRTGTILPDTADRVTSVAWCADNKTLFYVTEDPLTKRSNIVWRHALGEESEPVYQEKDRHYEVELERSKDLRMLFLRSVSTDTWETRFLSSDRRDAEFKVVLPRERGHKYSVEHRDSLFYVRTNRGAKNFRLVIAPVSDPSPPNWKELVPGRDGVLLQSVEVFRDYLVASEKSAALEHFRVLDFKTNQWHEVGFPDAVYAASAEGTPEYTAHTFRFTYQSMVTPASVYDYDMGTWQRLLRKREEVPGYDPIKYATERQWAMARDGVKIPLSIVHRKGLKKDGGAPLFLYGYGSYGLGTPAAFDSNRLALLDRGMTYVIAHVRGGDEMGEIWHDDGMLMKKKNTFHDFIDSAEWLIANRWTSKDWLVIDGASAGGLLIAAVTNMRPDLFRAAHCGVPFVDVINTMMDAGVPLTATEYLEWGNPNEKPAFDYMRSYSPYDNLERKAYPAILVTTSLDDSQVMYWEPTKYVAKLRTLKTDNKPLLLKCNMGAGHGGASGRYDSLKEVAFEYAWLMSQVGIRK